MRAWLAACAALGLAACASAPKKPADVATIAVPPAHKPALATRPAGACNPSGPAQEDLSKRGDYVAGGLYKPGVRDSVPSCIPDVDAIPEPAVVALPRSAVGNRPVYVVLDREYRVLDDTRGFVEQGLASFYGEKFHGRRTSNLEVYDMFAFSAAHKSLPIPSFARVTNLDTGKSVVVRVNDRGPFHEGRVIDLSYAAAVKLGIHRHGTGRVEVRALQPDAPTTLYATAPTTVAPSAPAMGSVTTKSATTRSPMDRLVGSIPAQPANAAQQPVMVAMSNVAPATRAQVASQAPATTTASPPVTAATTTPASPPNDYRFDMRRPDGTLMSADEFDAWMARRQVRVATGRPAAPPAKTPAPVVDTPAPVAPASSSAMTADAVVLQIASFAARDNADRALAKLRGAGIDTAELHDGEANGQKVWRLRVGPLAVASEAELAARISGLGFGLPRRVRD